MRSFLICVALTVLCSGFARAQSMSGMTADSSSPAQQTPGMEMQSGEAMSLKPQSFVQLLQVHATAGTDAEPASTPREMLMMRHGRWTLMLHGEAFLNALQQSGPRGGDKLFSTNWIMPMAQRKLGRGLLTLRTMLSLEPATISRRRYPELLQQGETAFGTPIVDGQHPHDFFMELAAMYDYRVSENTLVSVYAAPVGDPAMGPLAYPHRASTSENPLAPLGHHLQDSTHIASDVVTVGVTHRILRIEASGFHGREPDEGRWNIDSGAIDSWSSRITLNPGKDWSLQYSLAEIHSPEWSAPEGDLRRMTASVMFNRPLRNGNWSSLLLWGRNRLGADGAIGNAYLFESTLRFYRRNHVWTRIENVDRTNELLPEETAGTERYIARVQAYTAGYDRELGHFSHLSLAVGGQATWYGVPENLRPAYGSHPMGGLLFVRARLQ